MIDCMEKTQLQLIDVAASSTSGPNRQPTGQPPSYLSSLYPNQPSQTLDQSLQAANQQQQNGNELIGYYFGSISRETAEWILRTHGDQLDGAYLLRSSGPNDDFVLSLMVVGSGTNCAPAAGQTMQEVLHYKIVETEDSFVALHGQVGDEKFATIDELIDKAQGVATKPRWPILRQTLECQILPPTYWGLSVDQVRLAILIKARQWGFPLLASLFPTAGQPQEANLAALNDTTTLNNETIRTLIYKSLHEFQPWFHGKISREEAEKRIEEGSMRDGRFLVRERDNYSYAMCISHKKTTKHYRIDVLPTGELAIQDGRKFTSLMALVSHYTIMSDGLWCALTDACVRPLQQQVNQAAKLDGFQLQHRPPAPSAALASGQYSQAVASANASAMNHRQHQQSLYSGAPPTTSDLQQMQSNNLLHNVILPPPAGPVNQLDGKPDYGGSLAATTAGAQHLSVATSIRGPIREWLQSINHKWSQLMANRSQHHQSSMNSFLFGSQNPLNNHQHCRRNRHHSRNGSSSAASGQRRCKNGHTSCGCIKQMMIAGQQRQPGARSAQAADKMQLANYCNANPQLRFPPLQVNNACCSTIAAAAAAAPNPVQSGAANMLPNNGGLVSSLLPQNSGFSLNGQSFVGSPLFAVAASRQLAQQQQQLHFGTGASASARSVSNSTSSTGSSQVSNVGGQVAGGHGTAEEGKLISPVQSISGDANQQQQQGANPYQVNLDIYGSVAASTAVINDRREQALTPGSASQGAGNNVKFFAPPSVQYAGPILCGQHAGPAYRYTNAGPNDENSFRQCFHNQPQQPQALQQSVATYNRRAADDSQLLQGASQLVGPAAMARFVQFQDGQCLRTHRDTKSIQMAYLSSRQQQQQQQTGLLLRNNQQAPLGELNGQQQVHQQQRVLAARVNTNHQHQFQSSLMLKNNGCPSNECGPVRQQQLPGLRPVQANNQSFAGRKNGNPLSQQEPQNGVRQQVPADEQCTDIDLIDCSTDRGADFDAFEGFKCDPKLIKSSSIETLCGITGADEADEVEVDLANFKSNTELIMSQLQTCWQRQPTVSENEHQTILSPTPIQANRMEIPDYNCSTDNPPSSNNNNNHNGAAAAFYGDACGKAPLNEGADRQADGFEHLRKKHDLDELTTNLLAELTASLKAQVDMKNKRSGLASCFASNAEQPALESNDNNLTSSTQRQQRVAATSGQMDGINPLELINEFDSLKPGNKQ